MEKTKPKPKPVETRTLHVPKKVHQAIVLKAAQRDEDIQEVTVRALLAGLSTLPPNPQISSN